MNARPDQLQSIISKTVYPVYMVSGNEPLQQMQSLDTIRAFLRTESYLEREVLDVDAQFDWQRLHDEAASLSLFATRRIVELRLPSAKPGRAGSQVLKDYLARPPEDTVLIINAGKIDGNAKKSAWYKAIEKMGLLVQCWPLPVEQLPRWLMQQFKKRDIDADMDAINYISQHVEGNLLAADQEIEKILLNIGPGKISYKDVVETITAQSRYNVFELVDVLLSGDTQRAIKVIAGLKAEAVVPVMVNWALAKDIRLLAQASKDVSTADYLLKRSGVWQSRVTLFKSCLSRHPQRAFHQMLMRCSYIDGVSKGMVKANVWDEIETLCVRLSGSSKSTVLNEYRY